jgi:hypothetical protein
MRLCALLALTTFLSTPLWAQETVDPAADAGEAVEATSEVAPSETEVNDPTLEEPASAAAADQSAAPSPDEMVPVEQPHGLYEELGSAGDWTAIRFQPAADRTVCAIFSRPTDSTITEDSNPIAALRGERAAFITWETGTISETGGVFSAMIGAPLASPFDGHSFTTEGGTFTMFGHDDRLYTEAASDAEAIAAIRSGMTLTVEATLPGGRMAKDVYSLKGVVAATKLAADTCVVPG